MFTISLAARCIVIGAVRRAKIFGFTLLLPARSVCVSVCVFATGGRACICVWVCYHDNWKLITGNCVHRSSPNWVCRWKVVTISSWLNFGRPAPPGRGSAAWRKFFDSPYYSASGCVVECRICNQEVAGSNLRLGYFARRSTQPSIPPGSVNEYQL